MDQVEESRRRQSLPGWLRSTIVLALLYAFLGGVKLLEEGIKGLGSDATNTLFEGVTNPLAALFVGILATVLVQSSSVTTSTIVGLVAGGVLDVQTAVPMIMGANIGTTVTNTIVSIGHVRRSEEFRRAFAAATMHDFFNVLAVAILLPLQILTGFLSSAAEAIAQFIAGGQELGGSFDSPIKSAVGWFADEVGAVLGWFTDSEHVMAVLSIIVGIGLIFFTLTFITKNMRVLVADRIERSLNAALARSGTIAIVVGAIVTIAVQSSSITTSILVPLVASGVLLLRNAYPITLGANIGTTITALLAALATGEPAALTVALSHLLFNLAATLLIYVPPPMRAIPLALARAVGRLGARNRPLAGFYILLFFYGLPILLLLLSGVL